MNLNEIAMVKRRDEQLALLVQHSKRTTSMDKRVAANFLPSRPYRRRKGRDGRESRHGGIYPRGL